jgi:Rrf2 family protein
MRLSAKTEYAAVAMLELARRWEDGEPVRLREIAEMHGVPQRFLVQILLQLKAAGLVTSTRGAAGGYRLARPPATITLEDVRTVVEGPAEPVMLLSGRGASASTARVLGEAWRQVASRESAALRGLDLATLAARTQPDTEAMYYI